MNTLDLFMQTVPDGSSFKYRMTCLATGDQIIKQSVNSHKFTSLQFKSMNRILKYVARLNYSHFSQFTVPLTKISAVTYNNLKKNI